MQRCSIWFPILLCVGCAGGSPSWPDGSNGTAPGQDETDSETDSGGGETDEDGEGSGGVGTSGPAGDTSGGPTCLEGDGCEIGDPCSTPQSCASGFCVDGVCCDTACDGTCERCDPLGICIADTPASDPECGEEEEATWTLGLGAPVDVEAEPDSNFDRGSSAVTDEAGNVYLVGTFNQQIDFGGGVAIAAADDPFIVSFTPDGTYRWHTRFGGPGHDTAGGVALLPGTNDIVFAGASTGDPGLPGTWPDDQLNAVVATFNRDTGAVTGARALEATEQSRSLAVTTDASSIYVTGGFHGTFQVGGQTPSLGDEDLFAVRLDASLQPTWTWTDGDTLKDLGRGIAVSQTGDVALTGFVSASEDSQDIIVTRFTAPLGNAPTWRNVYVSPPAGAAKGHAVGWTPEGDVMMAGFYTGPVDFGQSSPDGGGRDAVLVRLSGATGTTVWANTYGGASDDHFRALDIDAAGNTFIAGDFTDTVTFDAVLTSNGGKDALVAKFSPDGNLLWIHGYGGVSSDNGNAITLSADGMLFTTGHYRERTTFGTVALSAAEGADIFLMRLGQ